MQTVDAESGYAHLVDNSTPESLARTLQEAADEAGAEGARINTEADALDAEGRGLLSIAGMEARGEAMIREAAGMKEDGGNRLRMSAKYGDMAAQVGSRASA